MITKPGRNYNKPVNGYLWECFFRRNITTVYIVIQFKNLLNFSEQGLRDKRETSICHYSFEVIVILVLLSVKL